MADTPTQAPKIDRAKLDKEASWIGARLREPSTYAGLAVVLGMLHITTDPNGLAHALTLIGTGVGAIVAMVLPDPGSKA